MSRMKTLIYHFETKSCINEHFVQKRMLNVLYLLFSFFFKLFTLPEHCTGAIV